MKHLEHCAIVLPQSEQEPEFGHTKGNAPNCLEPRWGIFIWSHFSLHPVIAPFDNLRGGLNRATAEVYPGSAILALANLGGQWFDEQDTTVSLPANGEVRAPHQL